MLRSLYSAVSGIDVNQKSMDVIGNNIANVNTIGFKQGRAVFQDMLSQTLQTGKSPSDARGGINPRQVGTGAYLVAVDNIFSQGTIKTTARTNDLAIEGNGFFVVRGEGDTRYFTRAGDFNFDRSGYLTTPSGYKVQGWMSDPRTGQISYGNVVGDIFVSDPHRVMQARATTNINFAGILDTRAEASRHEFAKLLTQATGNQSIFSISGYQGNDLDLQRNEAIEVKAHATGITDMGVTVNQGDSKLDLAVGDQITFTMGTNLTGTAARSYTFSYDNINSAAGNTFRTLQDLVDLINSEIFAPQVDPSVIPPDPTTNIQHYGDSYATIDKGRVVIVSRNMNGHNTPAGTTNFSLDVTSGNSKLLPVFADLKGGYSAQSTRSTQEMFFRTEIKAGENFTDLDGLARVVSNSLNGTVATRNAFTAHYMENNFGLNSGDWVEFDVSVTGTSHPIRVQYIDTPPPNPPLGPGLAANQFHTITDFARAIQNQLADIGAPVSTPSTGNGFNIQLSPNAGPITLEFTSVTTKRETGLPVPNDYTNNVSPYLEGVMSNIMNQRIGAGQALRIDEISGKGRISYSVTPPTNPFGMTNGEAITFNSVLLPPGTSLTFRDNMDASGSITEFNNIQQLVELLKGTANGGRGPGIPPFNNPNLAVDVVNNQITVRNTSGLPVGPITVSATTTAANPYLADIVGRLNGTTIAAGATIASSTIFYNDNTVTGLSITKLTTANSGFDANVLTKQKVDLIPGVNAGTGFAVSQQFLTQATEDTLMLNLFDRTGQYVGFSERDSIGFSALIGGRELTRTPDFVISFDSTVLNMMAALQAYIGVDSPCDGQGNVSMKNGVITVRGEKGAGNDISNLILSANSSPSENTAVFNNTVGQPQKKDTATGGIFTSEMAVYDEQGNKHIVKFEFSLYNEARNEWAMRIASGQECSTVRLNGAATNELIMRFNSDGTPSMFYDNKVSPIRVISNPTLDLTPSNGANSVRNVAINLGTAGQRDGLILSAASMNISTNESDGNALGVLDELLFNPAGEIVGYYTNGQIRTVGQVALATFQNNQGLLKVGDTMFASTGNSGAATIGTPMSGSRGQIASSALENSNVDLSTEFVNMIVTQRGFQANSRVVTTSDEMIQELLNLKR